MLLLDYLFNTVSLNFQRAQVVLQIKHGVPGYENGCMKTKTNIFDPERNQVGCCVLIWENRYYFVTEDPSSHIETLLSVDL